MGEGLLAVYVPAHLEGLCGDDCVGVVGSTYDNRIDLVAELVEHLTVVFELLSVRILVEFGGCIAPVNVAKADDVLGLGKAVDVGAASAADADSDYVQAVIGARSADLGSSHCFCYFSCAFAEHGR